MILLSIYILASVIIFLYAFIKGSFRVLPTALLLMFGIILIPLYILYAGTVGINRQNVFGVLFFWACIVIIAYLHFIH